MDTQKAELPPVFDAQFDGSESIKEETQRCAHVAAAVQPAVFKRQLRHWLIRSGEKCATCDTDGQQSLWICLTCREMNCGRADAAHAAAHFEATKHPLVVDVESRQAWCYVCDDYIDPSAHRALQNVLERLQEARPRTGPKRRSARLQAASGNDNPEVLDDTLEKPPVPGLQNLGNTCFFNSTMQCLLHVEALGRRMQAGELCAGAVATPFAKLYAKIAARESRVENPSELFSAIAARFKIYKRLRQQDSHELLRRVLDTIHEEELADGRRPAAESVIAGTFGGQLVSAITCAACHDVSCTPEPFYDVSLPLPGSSRSDSTSRRRKPSAPANDAASDTGKRTRRRGTNASSVSARQLENASVTTSEAQSDKETSTDDEGIATMLESMQMGESSPETAEMPHGTLRELFSVKRLLPTGHSPHSRGATTVEECLEEFTAVEVLDGENRRACDACRPPGSKTPVRQPALKRYLFAQLPSVLVLHLKRFCQRPVATSGRPGGAARGAAARTIKLETLVQFSETLDLEALLAPAAVRPKDTPAPTGTRYRLSGVVLHQGTLAAGHYTAMVRTSSGWAHASDTRVVSATWDEVVCPQAYILFYERLSTD